MFQTHEFEKVSSENPCAKARTSMNSDGWGVSSQIVNVFAFLILALLIVGGAGQVVAEDGNAPLDLNRATSAQLEALPGIGAVKAAAILAVRDARGGFESMDQLESVRGIGPALMNKLRPLVVLGAPATSKPASSAKPLGGSQGRSKVGGGAGSKSSSGLSSRSAN